MAEGRHLQSKSSSCVYSLANLIQSTIFQEGVPALTVQQPEEAAPVLKEQAEVLKVSSCRHHPSLIQAHHSSRLQSLRLYHPHWGF